MAQKINLTDRVISSALEFAEKSVHNNRLRKIEVDIENEASGDSLEIIRALKPKDVVDKYFPLHG